MKRVGKKTSMHFKSRAVYMFSDCRVKLQVLQVSGYAQSATNKCPRALCPAVNLITALEFQRASTCNSASPSYSLFFPWKNMLNDVCPLTVESAFPYCYIQICSSHGKNNYSTRLTSKPPCVTHHAKSEFFFGNFFLKCTVTSNLL